MDIAVRINSVKRLDNVTVRIYGIYADYYRMNKSEKASIKPGQNTIQFTYTTPPCNRCSGIGAGNYVITAEVSYNGKVIARSNRDVTLEQ